MPVHNVTYRIDLDTKHSQSLCCNNQNFSSCVYIYVKVQSEALAESNVVLGRRLTVAEEGLFSGIATSTVQVSYTRYTFHMFTIGHK